jgi:hypothetical protein
MHFHVVPKLPQGFLRPESSEISDKEMDGTAAMGSPSQKLGILVISPGGEMATQNWLVTVK